MEISKPAPLLKPRKAKTIKSLETSTQEDEILHTNELAFLYNSISLDETTQQQQQQHQSPYKHELPKKAKLKKIKGSGFKVKKNLGSSQSERVETEQSNVDKDMIILAIKQLQNKMSKTKPANKIEHFDLQNGLRISTPKTLPNSTNLQPRAKPLPKIIRQKSSIYKLPPKIAESNPTIHHNSYAKYLAGKSNLNLKTDISFRRNHSSRENLEYSFLKEATPDTGYMNFLNKSRMNQLTTYQKSTSSTQKLPLVPGLRSSTDNLNSDSFNHSIFKSTSKNFNDASRTSFESIDFVKKISPQNKYDLADIEANLKPTQTPSEYILDFSTVDVLEKNKNAAKVNNNNISAPCTTPLATPITDILHLNRQSELVDNRIKHHRSLIEKSSSDRRKTITNRTPRPNPRHDLNANFLSNSMHNLTFTTFNESIQTHLDELKNSQRPQDDGKVHIEAESNSGETMDYEIVGKKSGHDRVSEMNDKLYLDIFIPCIR